LWDLECPGKYKNVMINLKIHKDCSECVIPHEDSESIIEILKELIFK